MRQINGDLPTEDFHLISSRPCRAYQMHKLRALRAPDRRTSGRLCKALCRIIDDYMPTTKMYKSLATALKPFKRALDIGNVLLILFSLPCVIFAGSLVGFEVAVKYGGRIFFTAIGITCVLLACVNAYDTDKGGPKNFEIKEGNRVFILNGFLLFSFLPWFIG